MKNRIMNKPEVNAIFGMKVNEAREHLESRGYTMRIVIEDGSSKMVPYNIQTDRVNVIVVNGKIDNIKDIS